MEKRKCCEDCNNCDIKTNLTGFCNIKEEMLVLNSYCSNFVFKSENKIDKTNIKPS